MRAIIPALPTPFCARARKGTTAWSAQSSIEGCDACPGKVYVGVRLFVVSSSAVKACCEGALVCTARLRIQCSGSRL